MYIDFHYYMIKVLAVKAGFSIEDAEDIAYASEYVDDALEFLPMSIDSVPKAAESLLLKNRKFNVVCTAHDEDTFVGGVLSSGQDRTYVPFHFIPRHDKSTPRDAFDFRTSPDCLTARELVETALKELSMAAGAERTRKLIKLGIALHSYADTWAHKDFSGRFSPDENAVANMQKKGGGWEDVKLDTLPAIVPETGHAKAFAYPDSSHLVWQYYNGETREYFLRNNPELYLEAARAIYGLLCRAAGKPDEWGNIADAVAQCVRFEPRFQMWEKNPDTGESGLDEKIKFYMSKFGDVFPGGRRYDELLWKTAALKPYSEGPNNTRRERDFKENLFNMRNLFKEQGQRISRRFQEILDDGKLSFVADSFLAYVKSGNPFQQVASEVAGSIANWYGEFASIRYEMRNDNPDHEKWFHFHVEAAAQRRFVLERTHLAVEDLRADEQEGLSYLDDKLPSLSAQIGQTIINSLERWIAIPSGKLTDRFRWLTVNIQNDTPYRVVWAGTHRDDFSVDGCSGRYWDRPDKFGTISPHSRETTFSACNKNNSVGTGCSGVALFALVDDHGNKTPFMIAFSNPLLSDGEHAARLLAYEAARRVYDAAVAARNSGQWVVQKLLGGSLPELPPYPVMDTDEPKCRVVVGDNRQSAYDQLDSDAKRHNEVENQWLGRRIKLSAIPGKEARVAIST